MFQRVLGLNHNHLSREEEKKELKTYIHDVVEHYERRPFCFGLIPDAYLSDAPIAAEKIIQVVTRDLIVQILDEENAVGAGR